MTIQRSPVQLKMYPEGRF